MYRGYYTCNCPESKFPELERLYYNQTLAQQFPDSEEEVAQEVERRHLLKQVRYFYNKIEQCPISMSNTIIALTGQVSFGKCVQRGCPLAQKDSDRKGWTG